MLSAVQMNATNKAVVVSGYSPSVSTFGDGKSVNVSGQYPFSDTAIVTTAGGIKKLQLRAPCWTEGVLVSVSGAVPTHAAPCNLPAWGSPSRQW